MGNCMSICKTGTSQQENTHTAIEASNPVSSTSKPTSTTTKPASSTSNSYEIDKTIISRYEFGKTLGKGASCRVVEGIEKINRNNKLAIKIMSKDKEICSSLYNHEINILSKLNHPNILRLVGHEEDKENFYIYTKLCEGGELFDRIVSEHHHITEKYASELVKFMLLAVKYLHDNNIVHRDLKPENFVFESDDPNSNLILIDFGCSKITDGNTEYNDMMGTVYYIAPELVIKGNRYPKTGALLKKSDIWSLGVITYVMLTGRPPFKGKDNQEIFTSIVRNPFKFPSDMNLSEECKDFISKILNKNPYTRVSIEELLQHEWIVNNTNEEQLNRDILIYLRQFNYQCKLKKAIIQILANNMSEEPEKEIYKHFVRLDKDHDNFLNKDELVFLLLDLGYTYAIAEEESENILRSNDLNSDRLIDFGEFKAAWHRKLLSSNEQYIHKVFEVFDHNHDGHIDLNELQESFKYNDLNVFEMLREVDKNKDKKISFVEFRTAMQEDLNLPSHHNSTSSFGGIVPDGMTLVQVGAGLVSEEDIFQDLDHKQDV